VANLGSYSSRAKKRRVRRGGRDGGFFWFLASPEQVNKVSLRKGVASTGTEDGTTDSSDDFDGDPRASGQDKRFASLPGEGRRKARLMLAGATICHSGSGWPRLVRTDLCELKEGGGGRQELSGWFDPSMLPNWEQRSSPSNSKVVRGVSDLLRKATQGRQEGRKAGRQEGRKAQRHRGTGNVQMAGRAWHGTAWTGY
jgi:hypothetical protein